MPALTSFLIEHKLPVHGLQLSPVQGVQELPVHILHLVGSVQLQSEPVQLHELVVHLQSLPTQGGGENSQEPLSKLA
jgi:hypothetical protein